MAASFVGQILLIINGLPVIHVKSLDADTDTGRELVMGMNPLGGALGHSNGSAEYSLNVEVYVPRLVPDIPWENIDGAVIMIAPKDGGVPVKLYTGVFTTRVGFSSNEKGAATQRIDMKARNKIEIG